MQNFSRSWTCRKVFQVLWRQLTQSGQAWESVEGRGRQLMMLNTPNDICQVETNVDILIMTSTIQTNIHSIKTRAQQISSVPVNKILLWRQVHLTGFFKIINLSSIWLLYWDSASCFEYFRFLAELIDFMVWHIYNPWPDF